MIKAIETRFRGILFRSRLEARWAVFFETLGLPWLYESEGFDLPSRNYLPDFWLPRQKTWVEIKPEWPEHYDSETRHLEELATMTQQRVWHACGSIPAFRKGDQCPENEIGYNWNGMFFPVIGWDTPYHWCRCKHCGEYGLQFDGRSERIDCCPANNGHKDYTADEQTIVDAYAEARTRRFEHEDKDQWR